MAVGVAVLHVDDLCKGLCNTADEGHGLLVLLFQRAGLPAHIEANGQRKNQQRGEARNDIEPRLLIEGLFLDDLNGDLLAAAPHGVLELHSIMIGAAVEVGIVHGDHVAAADGGAAVIKALQPVAHLRVAQGVVEHKAGDRQLLGAGRDREGAVRVRVDRRSVRLHVGNDRLEIADILKGLVNIDLAHAGAAGDIQVAVFVKAAVGVCRGDAGQAVCETVVYGADVPVCKQLLSGHHINAVAAEHPHIPLAVFIEVEVVGIGELLYCCNLIVRRHIGDGAAGDDPDDPVLHIALETHHNVRRQPVLHINILYAGFVDDIDAAAVGAENDLAVHALLNGETFRIPDAVLIAVGADHAVILNDVHTAGERDQDRPVLLFRDGAQTAVERTEQTLLRGEGHKLAVIVAQKAQLSPGGYPCPALAVADDGTDPAPVEQLYEVVRLQIFAGGGLGAFQRQAGHGTVFVEHRQPRIRTDKEHVVADAGRVHHALRQAKALKQIGKLVRYDLHDALARGAKPQVAEVIDHHAADTVIHGQVFQQMKVAVINNADTVGAAEPDPAVDVFYFLHIAERLDVDGFDFGKRISQPGMMELEVGAFKIQLPRFLRVGKDRPDAADDIVCRAQIALQPPVPDRHQVAVIGNTVDEPVAPGTQVAHVGLGDELFLHHAEMIVGIDHDNAAGRRNIDRPVRALRDGSGVGRFHAVQLAPHPELALFHDRHTVVIRSHPEAVLIVHEQTFDAGDAVGGIHTLKGIAVVTDQTCIAADPDKAVAGLNDGVGLGSRQSAGVVIQHRGIPLCPVHNINRDMPICIEAAGLRQCGAPKLKHQYEKQQQAYTRFVRTASAPSARVILFVFHANTPSNVAHCSFPFK